MSPRRGTPGRTPAASIPWEPYNRDLIRNGQLHQTLIAARIRGITNTEA